MARPRKKDSGEWFAWSDIYMGGESRESKDGRKIIVSRNILACGEPVSAEILGITDAEFDHLKENGSVRDYPLPEDMPKNYPGSPIQFVQDKLARQREDEQEDVESEGEMLMRSYVTGSLFAAPSHQPEIVLPGVEEVTVA